MAKTDIKKLIIPLYFIGIGFFIPSFQEFAAGDEKEKVDVYLEAIWEVPLVTGGGIGCNLVPFNFSGRIFGKAPGLGKRVISGVKFWHLKQDETREFIEIQVSQDGYFSGEVEVWDHYYAKRWRTKYLPGFAVVIIKAEGCEEKEVIFTKSNRKKKIVLICSNL